MIFPPNFGISTPSALRWRAVALATRLALASPLLLAGTGQALAQAQTRAPNASPADANAMRDYAVPAGPLGPVLGRIAGDAGLNLGYGPAQVDGRMAAPVHGRYSAEEALRAALRGSGLRLQRSADGVYTLVPAPATATGAAAVAQLPSVEVTGSSALGPGDGLVALRSSAGTKTDTALIETPQAVSVVTRAQMKAQAVQNVPQAMRYTSGTLTAQRGFSEDGGGLEEIYSRGFLVDQYLDGLRLPSRSLASYGVSAVDPYGLESITLVHGPASVLYGQASPGGVLDLQSKRPTDEPLHEIGLQTGSHGLAQTQFDFSDALDDAGNVRYRITGLGRTADTQVDHVQDKRVFIAPSFSWQMSPDTKFTLLTGYQYDPDGGYYNTLPYVGTQQSASWGKIPTDFDPGEPGFDHHSRKQYWVGYELEHRVNDTWSLSQHARYTGVSNDLRGVFANGWVGDAEDHTLNRYALKMYEQTATATIDNQAKATFDTGSVHHKAIVGLDYQATRFDQRYGYNFGSVPSLDVLNPVYGQPFDAPTTSGDYHTNLHQLGLYAQDQLALGQWRFLLGGRQDWARSATRDLLAGGTERQQDQKATWRAGTTYLFDNGLAPYVSYSTSFQPQAGAVLADGSMPKPTTGEQYEAGVKYQMPGSQSFVTLAAFNLRKTNILTTDPVTQLNRETGAIRSRGIEAEAHLALTREWTMLGSYTYMQLRNTRTDDPTEKDKRPIGTPAHTASVWTDYTLHSGPLAGLGANIGVRFVGSSFGDAANTFTTPSYTVVDAGLHYTMPHWDFSLNAANLFDRKYVASCMYSMNACNYGSRRLILAGATYSW
ncbi:MULTISPECIES: TonB-dependent siderophore receptor [unclassified Achromobacter]|uniref:TonB-dependent siderophore receptor n=1 Tax=unclassified Achromobacter TaxID=2626865 RepID=UPI000B51DB98|nr:MULTISPECIES: TonB-dependent siderophore receptor [unclassified Achromobacter]OWT68175.1 TonB-dependent siderophore receptor [Achromobacter sp. HZ34]OWT70012.1 TonB-dependent siderophore receptor [Achromobacter sp. HZ28]